jgi:hypothetical protein
MSNNVKQGVSAVTGTATGSSTGAGAVYLAGHGAGRAGAVLVTHGLKVLGLGSMGVGLVTTGVIAIGTAALVYKGVRYILDRMD